MGLKNIIVKAAEKAADATASLAKLSPQQLIDTQVKCDTYLSEMPDPGDSAAVELTNRLLAAGSVEIFNSYLPQISKLYLPVDKDVEYSLQEEKEFDASYNVRYFNITRWVCDKKENSLEKLVNVYAVLSNEDCNIALVFHRTTHGTDVYLGVVDINNTSNSCDVKTMANRLREALRGNFPGVKIGKEKEGHLSFIDEEENYSVASVSNVPTESSEKFISQTIEKLLDGTVPVNKESEYTLILLATPIKDIEERKIALSKLYSGLMPYSQWETGYQFSKSDSQSSTATFGVNIGASAGIQNGQSQTISQTDTHTNTKSITDTDAESYSKSMGENSNITDSNTHTKGNNKFSSDNAGVGVNASATIGTQQSVSVGYPGVASASGSVSKSATVGASANYGHTWGQGSSLSDTVGKAISIGKSITDVKGKTKSLAKSIGNSVSKAVGIADSLSKSINFGANAGANFARSSTITALVGKNESINQHFINYNIKHTLEVLETQMKRYDACTALGMWDFAAYVISEDYDVANNVAHTYLALTQGEQSYTSQSSVNLWRGNKSEAKQENKIENEISKEIVNYLRDLRHPVFGINPKAIKEDPTFCVYPTIVTPTTPLSGKELAYSLNFPQKSISGLPVIECVGFGRNVNTNENYYDDSFDESACYLGKIFHMNEEEHTSVYLSRQSLASHTFVTGSTGSGKSNTVYKILNESIYYGTKFLVIEPAKGEYKDVFGNDDDVFVYGTNPAKTPLLRINPFSFPNDIHVLEHLDRLVEIFNVCWPMYAAMPAVLKNAVEKSYEDCGWNLVESVNEYGDNLYPTFVDVARNVKAIIDSSEYDNENKGAYKGSLLTRLQSLTNGINGLIFVTDELSSEALFDQNVIVDISRVGSTETKSLIMGMLVLKLQEYRMSTRDGLNAELKHITVLEEAHNILKRTSMDVSSESANLAGKSVEMISNAIAEMRTYGEGFIIADQAPGLLDMAAIRNTNTKIIMRLPDLSDRELVGRATNLNDDQITELAKLPCGVAAVYQNEWIQPVLCKVDRVDTDGSRFSFNPDILVNNTDNSDIKVEIAELLSNGTKFDKEALSKIKEKMDVICLPASIQVSVLKMLDKPAPEPRMTKLAPIMSALFPEVHNAVKEIYTETHDVAEWTSVVTQMLNDNIRREIFAQVRRDIIQGIMTQYLLNEMNDIKSLEKWSKLGNLI